jgi:DNA replicative helicase MCM subunit Mcm2 (Cdc46/Mcm family)
MNCDTMYEKTYDPHISWDQFDRERYKGLFTCKKCNVRCESIPHFENMSPEDEQKEVNKRIFDKLARPLSVVRMRQQLAGQIIGYGTLVGVTEQYVVVSRTTAICSGNIRCACDAAPDEHTRPCGYAVDIKHHPPVPVIVSVFDTGNGKSLVCPRCKGIDYEVTMDRRIAKLIKLEDAENHNADISQDVVVYDSDVEDLTPGELVQVEGEMFVERKPGSSKSTKMDNVVHASSIKYLKKKEVTISQTDVKNFHRWIELSDKEYQKELRLVNQYETWSKLHKCEECRKHAKRIIPMTFTDRLVSAFAPNVIGWPEAKLGLLRSIVGGRNRGDGALSGKIHTFLVGDPRTAKSKLGEEAMKIKPNCRHVSAPHATTKAITAVVDKESQMLRMGVIPLSDMVAIDEVTKFPIDDQSRLLSILQEQKFPRDAYGKHYEIPAQTSIIATANPRNTTWRDKETISDNEVDMLRTLRDRFTQVYSFRDDNDTPEKRLEFASRMSAILRRSPPNYTYLSKFLIYASGIVPEMSLESERTLNRFWAQEECVRVMKNRSHNQMFKIAEAQAKLQLRSVVDEDITLQVQKSMQVMILQYGSMVDTIVPMSQVTYNKFIEILQNSKVGITLLEMCKIASKEDPAIESYLAKKWSIENNWKLRPIVERLRNHSDIRLLKDRPMVFKWVGGTTVSVSDVSDVSEATFSKSLETRARSPHTEIKNAASDTSDTSDSNGKKVLQCPFQGCKFKNIHQDEIDHHFRLTHPS